MKSLDIVSELKNNSYPGRGIILGRGEDGAGAVLLYFIMGRSENSRNRVFTRTEDGIRTEAHIPEKLVDPSLVIYHPVRFFRGHVIVTNGDQTDTVRDFLRKDKGFREALLTRTFEPDPPIYTPRVSGLLMPDGRYALSILKSLNGDPACCCRQFFEYDRPLPGVGHLIHTYAGDGNPVPSFEGEPKTVKITGTLEMYAKSVWDALNSENKVSLYACRVGSGGTEQESLIFNKNLE